MCHRATTQLTALTVGIVLMAASSAAQERQSPCVPRNAPAATSDSAAPKTRATVAQLSWLAGEWSGSAGTRTFEERWTPPAGGQMMGVSRTLRNGAVSEFEFLCVVERDGGLVYVAMPNARPPTDFTLTKIDESSAVFENPAHDFPKMIRYAKRPDGGLDATISGAGGEKPRTFTFTRQK